jgi:hypothetical protein
MRGLVVHRTFFTAISRCVAAREYFYQARAMATPTEDIAFHCIFGISLVSKGIAATLEPLQSSLQRNMLSLTAVGR